MARIRHRAAALRRSERGFTLIELLVATMMSMVVFGGAVTVFIGAIHSEPRTSSKVSAIQQGRVAVERITRELRQGVDVSAATPSQLSLITYVKQSPCGGAPAANAKACRVTYACTTAECSRTVQEPSAGSVGTTSQVVSGLFSSNVFTYSPDETDPDYIGVKLSFTTQEGGPVVIADGTALRNVGS
jgi:Tfp pilus assembly protein PilW